MMMAKTVTLREDGLDIVRRYDALMYDPDHHAYFDGSDYTNFGYWDAGTRNQKQACDNLMERLLHRIPFRSGAVLDVACGRGGTTRYMLSSAGFSDVTAINLSLKQVETASSNAPGCRPAVMNAAELAFAGEAFDLVVCVEAAFHFRTRERFFREALRILRPGGYLVLSDILMTKEAEQRRPYRHVENFLDGPREYRELGRRVGFSEVEVDDATEPCWGGCYWHAVSYSHGCLLDGRMNVAELSKFLELSYRRAEDIRYYLLAWLRKGEEE